MRKESVAGIIALVKRVEELEEENSILRKAVEEEHQRAEDFLKQNDELCYDMAKQQVSISLLKSTQNIPANIDGIIYELIRTRLAYWGEISKTKDIDEQQTVEIELSGIREIFQQA